MTPPRFSPRRLAAILADYGMLAVLVLLGVLFTALTVQDQAASPPAAARQVAAAAERLGPAAGVVAIVAGQGADDAAFASELEALLAASGRDAVAVSGGPPEVRRQLEALAAEPRPIQAIACSPATSAWAMLDDVPARVPALADAAVLRPSSSSWPSFLKPANLLNIANQIAVIAIVAIGMTLVVLSGGIDLSVGSLIALSSVVTARLIRDGCGGVNAGVGGMLLGGLGGIAVCGACGLFSGLLVTLFRIPPFIATLGMMLIASGLAYILAAGQSINQVPDAFVWLGRGADLGGLPNAVVLMAVLYGLAHVVMSRTAFGRYVYAIGGNAEAARLSGVPVRRVTVAVYVLGGLLAGLGGIVMASQLKSGAPTYGQMYELYVIAAVVVGGTSLSGGEGRVLGTLLGAFIIATIQNGMNLTGVESYTQKVVLGSVILAAVLIDRFQARLR
ncbi:MAG: ABC transporter permease [Planctomycetota bacterium]